MTQPEVLPPLLAGAANFRAVKPYPAGASHLRANTIFRSGELSRLTEADLAAVAALNIRLICDLRTAGEQTKFPTAWPPHPLPARLHLPDERQAEAGPEKIFDLILSHPGETGARKAMDLLYRRKPRAFAASLRLLFDTVLRGDALPLLIHCHAGKDRTGFMIAMLLAAAGVSMADIMDDYVTTALYFPVLRESRAMAEWAKRAFDRDINPAHATPMAEAHPEFLAAAFDQINQDWGGVERYLREAVGLTPAQNEALQALLLA